MTLGLDPQDVRTALGALGAIQDEVTRLPNRRAFRMIGQQLLDVSARHNHALTLFVLRIDNLQVIEAAPDRRASRVVLVAIAEVLRATFRESDLLARLRDDEFAVVATAAGDDDQVALEGRLADELHAVEALREPIAVRLSLGAAPYERGATLNELIERAAASLRALPVGD